VVGFEWQPGRRGIGLLGKTRLGKTRGLFLVLKHALTSGISIDAISHGTFSNMVRLAYGAGDAEAESRLARLYQADVVMLDDLGKAPSTERADAELELLVEHLTSHNRTILWSANGSKEWLTGRFGPDRGPALVERLREFTYVIVCE
jgi:DNA replication protein DnaC